MEFGNRDPSVHRERSECFERYEALFTQLHTYYRDFNRAQKSQFDASISGFNGTNEDLARVLAQPGAAISEVTEKCFDYVGNVTEWAGSTLLETISVNEVHHVKKIENSIDLYGVDNFQLARLINGLASDDLKRSVMILLDNRLWREIEEKSRMIGPDSFIVNKLVSRGSSLAVQNAFKIGLDKLIWERVQEKAIAIGANSYAVNKLLQSAATIESQDVFLRANYSTVWADIQKNATTLGTNSYTVKGLLDSVNHGLLRIVFERHLHPQSTQDTYGRRNTSDYTNRYKTYGFYRHRIRQDANNRQNTNTDSRRVPTAETSRPAKVDWRIAHLQGKETGGTKKPYVTLLANIDHYREKGKTDAQIYVLLVKHFHPDKGHADSEAMMPVITAAYDNKEKRFKI